MSNQRAGKWKPASMSQGDSKRTVTFFKYAKKLLEEYNLETKDIAELVGKSRSYVSNLL